MNKRKFVAFLAAAVITIGAITTGTIILLQKPDEKPAGALSVNDLLKNVSDLQTSHPHLFPSSYPPYAYAPPSSYYIEFGEYPRTHIAEPALVAALNALTDANKTGRKYLVNGSPSISQTQTWTETLLPEYMFNGEKYVYMATNHAYESYTYTMSSGTNAQTNNLWFKVEPLQWFVTENDGTTLSLLAINEIISGIAFRSSDSSSATYYNSGIRTFLNGTGAGIPAAAAVNPNFTVDGSKSFLQTAFNITEQGAINSTVIDNQTDYSGYTDSADQNTTDKIYIPSHADLTNFPSYTRKARPTDFAMANYAYWSDMRGAGQYKLRSASNSSYSSIWEVDIDGALHYGDASTGFNGLRPAMQISLPRASYNYNLNGASETPPEGGTVTTGDTITLPTADKAGSRTGYDFAGWGVNSATTVTHAAGATDVVITADTTIYAIWTPINYTIEYNLGGGTWLDGYSPPAAYNITSEAVILPSSANMTAATGYTFLRWHEGSIDSQTVVTAIPAGSIGNRVYYAEWGYLYDDIVAALEAEKTALLEQITDLTKELDDYIKDHEHDYDKGYDDGKSEYIRDNGSVTWNVLVGSDAAGDLSEYTPYSLPAQYNYGEEIIPPENIQPVQSKQYTYTFLYWSASRQTNGTLPLEVTFPRTKTGGDIILYAIYKREIRTYTVTWIMPAVNVNSGKLDYDYSGDKVRAEIKEYKYGEAIIEPGDIWEVLYGDAAYIFMGWSSTKNGDKVTNFDKIYGDRIFYAKYMPQTLL
jgi:uncharacterized repeat protein (TIGR02543 family)